MQSFCIEERGTYKNNSGTGLKRRVELNELELHWNCHSVDHGTETGGVCGKLFLAALGWCVLCRSSYMCHVYTTVHTSVVRPLVGLFTS